MGWNRLPVRIASLALVGIGLALLVVGINTGGRINIALPLVFLVMGGGCFILVLGLRPAWAYAAWLYLPAVLLTAFGVIFLVNVLTQDWNSWAYAWLFLAAALGVGVLLVNHELMRRPLLTIAGWSITLVGLTFFVLFGAITGGILIQVMAAVLLVAAGVSLRWLNLERILPGKALRERLPLAASPARPAEGDAGVRLVEALSQRELDVLRLIDAGLSNAQIAAKLSVAPSTVKTHINNIYGKLGVQTRVQAVNLARELGLLRE